MGGYAHQASAYTSAFPAPRFFLGRLSGGLFHSKRRISLRARPLTPSCRRARRYPHLATADARGHRLRDGRSGDGRSHARRDRPRGPRPGALFAPSRWDRRAPAEIGPGFPPRVLSLCSVRISRKQMRILLTQPPIPAAARGLCQPMADAGRVRGRGNGRILDAADPNSRRWPVTAGGAPFLHEYGAARNL